MKKTFEYDLTKYSPDAPTRTEEFLTADGVKTLTTDANDGAVLIQDEVDEDSLNPVTAAAVAAAIEAGGGGGGTSYSAGDGISIADDTVSAKVDGTTIGVNASGELEAIGGGGSSLEAGQGIRIQNDKISVANDGNTLVLTEASITTEDNPYNTSSRNFYLDPVSLTNTCDIVFGGLAYTATLQATADQAGHTVRLALCGNGGTEYVFSKFNFRDLNADDIVLVEGSNTGIFSTATVVPSGRKWSDVFDFTGVNLEYFFGGDVSIYFVAWDDSTGSVVGNPWDAISLSSESGKQFIIYTDAVQTSLKVKNPLPDSSGASQGDVLKIGSSGPEWGSAGGGGAGIEFVTRSNTYEEVLAIYQAGKLPVLEYEIGSKKFVYVMTQYDSSRGHYLYPGVFLFTQWAGSSTDAYIQVLAGQLGVAMYTCYRDGNGATQWSSRTSYILPEYGNSDAGKVLQVQSGGTLAWVDPSSAYTGQGG